MAREIQLPQGQITPQAQPVEAFIQPSQSNVAQPNQLSQLGNPKGLSTVSTGGTTFVQGSNSFAELSQSLAPFSKNATEFLQTAGLMYAQGQIAEGERRAKEETLRAMALNDASMESDELKRAAFNRQLASKDPQAGGLMALLNPYAQIGWERGKSKMAGQEAVMGLPAYVARNGDRIDYTAPDQGFGALAQLQAEYTKELAQKYGIGIGTPGFQKYTLPEIEKVQEKIQTQHLSDRKNYFDTAAVGQAASLLSSLYSSSGAGVIEYNGETYRRSDNPKAFKAARQYKALQVLQQVILSSSLPGEATERSKKIFQSLSAAADYKNDPEFKSFIESIPSTEPSRGADGKVIINPESGEPYRQTWGELYGIESIDSEIKYGQAGYAERKRVREERVEGADGFDDGLLKLLGAIPGEGPEQKEAADQYVREWYERNGKRLGVGFAELQRRRDDLVDLDAKRYAELTNPEVIPSFWADLEADRGKFDAAAWRLRARQASAQIFDPEEKAAFIKQSNERIGSREIEQATFKAYDDVRDKVINDNIKSRTAQFYSDPTNADALESIARQRGAYTVQANAALLKKERELGRKLFDSEVRATVQETIQTYGRGSNSTGSSGQSQLDYLFPGSRRTDEPSVKGSGVNNYGKKPKTYNLSDLGSIENREIVLPNYRRNPVLSGDATVDLLKIAASGAAWPKSFDRAWRDSRAKSAGEFLLFHADHYGIEVPAEMRRQINIKTSAAANAGNAVVSRAATSQSNPLVASLGSFALNVLTGATPAAAATMPQAPVPRATYRPGGGDAPGSGGGGQGRPPGGGPNRPRQPQAYPLPDSYPALGAPPAAPVLPAPASTGVAPIAVAPYQAESDATTAARGRSGDLIPLTLDRPSPFDQRRAERFQPVAINSGNYSLPAAGGGGQWAVGPAVPASHPEAGAGFTIPGAKDANGRPLILGQGAANSFAAMVRDSGGKVRAADVASGKRSHAKNSSLPGAATNSLHLEGNAMDIHGTSIAWIRQHGAKYGWYVNDYDGSHGGHVEFRGGGSAGRSRAAATRPGGGLTGLATYYTGSGGSDGVAGGPTANGERYDPSAMTAAVQWSLRGKYMNKWVTVEDMNTGKTVRVWVNDVGSMGGTEKSVNRQDPRVIDLSPAAFKKLFGSTSRGVGRIRILEN